MSSAFWSAVCTAQQDQPAWQRQQRLYGGCVFVVSNRRAPTSPLSHFFKPYLPLPPNVLRHIFSHKICSRRLVSRAADLRLRLRRGVQRGKVLALGKGGSAEANVGRPCLLLRSGVRLGLLRLSFQPTICFNFLLDIVPAAPEASLACAHGAPTCRTSPCTSIDVTPLTRLFYCNILAGTTSSSPRSLPPAKSMYVARIHRIVFM